MATAKKTPAKKAAAKKAAPAKKAPATKAAPAKYRDWETDRKSTRLNSSH